MVATATTKTPRTTKAAAAKVEAEEVPANENETQKRNRLRNSAERYILNLHKDEFDNYAEALFHKNGLTFNRRLSEAQKAEKKIEDLIAKHPELEAVLRNKFVPTDADAPATDPEVHSTGRWTGEESVPPDVDYSADEEGYVDPFNQQNG